MVRTAAFFWWRPTRLRVAGGQKRLKVGISGLFFFGSFLLEEQKK